ncbi:hypothetical protein OG205_27935 [Lentzea sp. NBC_00516]|nr:hypothetical protein [Lentzea sp. NBC_00516]WUD21929.1 hypothetical protein OG205_27935 [Lentzea sp. NBC_00516]
MNSRSSGEIQLEQSRAGGLVQPERAGVQACGEHHDLGQRGAEQEVVVEAGAHGHELGRAWWGGGDRLAE